MSQWVVLKWMLTLPQPELEELLEYLLVQIDHFLPQFK